MNTTHGYVRVAAASPTVKVGAVRPNTDAALALVRRADEGGLEHWKVFVAEVLVGSEVRGTGRGKSKKKAEQAAALQAIQAHVDAAESK